MRSPSRSSAALLAAAAAVTAAAVLGTHADASADWTRAQSMSQRRSYIAAASDGRYVYAAGGMVGETGRPLAVFQRYDPRRDAWKTLTPLPSAVRAAEGAILDEVFYVAGGFTREGALTRVHAYDLARGSWEPRAPLPVARFNHAVVALGGRLYVVGGYLRGQERRDVWVYDPGANAWTHGPPLPRPLHAFGAVTFRGELWVIGGLRRDRMRREVWILDPRARRWRAGPPLPEPMELVGTTVAGDEIHAVWEHLHFTWDASEGRWERDRPTHVTRHALSLFHLDGALYAVGGCTTKLRDSPVVERLDLS